MNETIFGRLATVEIRSQYAQMRLQGVQHRRRLSPGSPRAGEQPVVSVIVGADLPIDEVDCLITEPDATTCLLYTSRCV